MLTSSLKRCFRSRSLGAAEVRTPEWPFQFETLQSRC
jgi:hypothetical protein